METDHKSRSDVTEGRQFFCLLVHLLPMIPGVSWAGMDQWNIGEGIIPNNREEDLPSGPKGNIIMIPTWKRLISHRRTFFISMLSA